MHYDRHAETCMRLGACPPPFVNQATYCNNVWKGWWLNYGYEPSRFPWLKWLIVLPWFWKWLLNKIMIDHFPEHLWVIARKQIGTVYNTLNYCMSWPTETWYFPVPLNVTFPKAPLNELMNLWQCSRGWWLLNNCLEGKFMIKYIYIL